MELKEIYSNLCLYDPRNEYYQDMLSMSKQDGESIEEFKEGMHKPGINCSCDNCFYGKNKLALEILRLRKIINGKEETSWHLVT